MAHQDRRRTGAVNVGVGPHPSGAPYGWTVQVGVVATIVGGAVGGAGVVGVGVPTVPLCSVSEHRYTCELVIKSSSTLCIKEGGTPTGCGL